MEDLPRFIIGHHDPRRPLPITADTIDIAHNSNYDMLTCPITTPYFHSRVLSLLSSFHSTFPGTTGPEITATTNASPIVVAPLSPVDTPLTPDTSISQIIGLTSPWVDLSSPDPIIADVSRQVLKLELEYAAFCGVTYVIIQGPRLRGQGFADTDVVQFARAILDALSYGPYIQLYIWLPIIDHAEEQNEQMGDLAPLARERYLISDGAARARLDLFGTWEAWNTIRSLCNYPSRLSVAISLPKLLPPAPIQSRWYSEPVRLLSLDAKIFAKNAKGYPVLSRAHQALITRFTHLRTAPWFILCDVDPLSSSLNDPAGVDSAAFPSLAQAADGTRLKDPHPHLSYMRNLQSKQPIPTAVDRFGAGYQDYLQAPLQPLTVNLESITYEVFEKDPIKYAWYERAIARALHDWIESGKPTSNPDGRVVVAVVGAGRGPLVTRALQAAEDVGVEIDMWALEKNPNAFVLLQRNNQSIWNNRVHLVKSDMRTWRGPARQPTDAKVSRMYNSEHYGESPDDSSPTQDPAGSTVAPDMTFTGSPTLDSTYLLATANTSTSPTPYKIDILISELLGSFADNELSPECLDGVQHLLNPQHGISIPASYSAHLTPIAAPKLYADITHGLTNTNAHAAQIPYVVMLNAIDFLSTAAAAAAPAAPSASAKTTPKSPSTHGTPYSKAHTHTHTHTHARSSSNAEPAPPASAAAAPAPIIHETWSFAHPNPSLPDSSPQTADPASSNPLVTTTPMFSNAHNARSCVLTFPIPNRATCHGLGGYFETVLYRGVELSTNPLTMDAKSEGMISWFPIFFPLKNPLTLPDNSEVRVSMWRRTDDRRVWYEWLVDVYALVPAATGGAAGPLRRVRIGGSSLHSSEKEACLM